MDGFQWDNVNMMVTDAKSGETNYILPILHMEPEMDLQQNVEAYCCPLYKTALRAGTLSTTGHSTNFIISVELPSTNMQDYWVAKGAALICQLNE